VEKLVYLTQRPKLAPASYRDHLLHDVAPRILSNPGTMGLTLAVNDLLEEIERPMLLLGEGAQLGAAVSIWVASLDERDPIESSLRAECDALEGYLVTESIPQACEDRSWPDGARSPGVTHFTWFEKAAGISEEAFYRAWHEVHTPFSFELHPLRWEYVRDAVVRPLTAGAPPIRAIVGERFRELRDYTDPKRLFGSKEVLKRSAGEAGDFGNPDKMNSLPLSEYIVRSTPWSRS
jgi:hypothetical protein